MDPLVLNDMLCNTWPLGRGAEVLQQRAMKGTLTLKISPENLAGEVTEDQV